MQRNDSQGKFNKFENVTNTKQAGNNNAHQNFSATKSQANITNNNFAKFSSSGYTNNNFLLASGHHDFIPSDFQVLSNGKQTGGNWNLDASQIEKNLKSTVKSKQGFAPKKNLNGTPGSGAAQNQNYMLNLSQEDSAPYVPRAGSKYIEVHNHEDLKPAKNMASDEIEESIIEEDIDVGAGPTAHSPARSPASPLINSRTKGKGKLDLFMMRPPKPDARQSRHNSNDLTSHFGGVPALHVPSSSTNPFAAPKPTHGTPPFIFNRAGAHSTNQGG